MDQFVNLFKTETFYEKINPKQHFKEHLVHGLRPNGRECLEYRPMVVCVDTLRHCCGSAIVKIGNSTFVCGIQCELKKPPKRWPKEGYFVINVNLPFTRGTTGYSNMAEKRQEMKVSQLCTNYLNKVYSGMGILNPESLCIFPGELVWVLNVDIYSLNYDGGLWDGTMSVLYAALRNTKLPQVEFEEKLNRFVVRKEVTHPLVLNACPVATTFGVFEGLVIADPSRKEENLCSSLVTFVASSEEELYYIHKVGPSEILEDHLYGCATQSKSRWKVVTRTVECALSNSK